MIECKDLKFDDKGLIPVITVDAYTGIVLMQAFMNEQAYQKTIQSGKVWYFSRSRKALWLKGETSGHFQEVVSITADCDKDCLLIRVKQSGNACHTGEYSCFYQPVLETEKIADAAILFENVKTIQDRAQSPVEGSYTNYLLQCGTDKICKKIGEEAAETIIAAKNEDNDELKNELADLYYHTLVLMQERGLCLNDVLGVLLERSEKERRRNY